MIKWTVAVGLIFILVLLFWREHHIAVPKVSSEINVIIQNESFTPDIIAIHGKKGATINFTMLDDRLCKEKVIIRNLGIEVPITLNKTSKITLKNIEPGKYHFECATGTFCGILFVVIDEKDQSGHYFVPETD